MFPASCLVETHDLWRNGIQHKVCAYFSFEDDRLEERHLEERHIWFCSPFDMTIRVPYLLWHPSCPPQAQKHDTI